MIQRIQSLYFLASAIISGIIAFFVSFFVGDSGPRMLTEFPIFLIGLMLVAIFSIVALVSFKKRQTQVVFGRLAVLLSFTVFSFMMYFWYDQYAMEAKYLGIGVFLPLANVILLSMANRSVMKDETLVRAADRFR